MSEQVPEASAADRVSAALNAPETTTPDTTPVAVGNTQTASTGGHPAWQEILNAVPESLHDKVRPTLEAWDKGVTERLGQVHSQYDPYKPVIEAGFSVDQLTAGAQLLNALNEDPQKFYDGLRDFYKFGNSEQGQTSQQESEVDLGEYGDLDLANHPQFKQLLDQQKLTAAQLESATVQQQEKEAELWLSSRQAELSSSLTEKGIDPDWDYILTRAQTEANSTGDFDKALTNASAAYEALVNKFRAPVAKTPAPAVMPPNGGGVPVTQFNSTNLSEAERKQLMAQMLNESFKGS